MATIDPSWTEIQIGLYLEAHSWTVNGVTYYNSRLHSADGYCFYDVDDEYYDEEGNLIPADQVQPNQRMYYQWCITPITDVNELNRKYISVPVQEGFEIANANQ